MLLLTTEADDGARAVGPRLGDEAVEQGGRWEGEEGLAVSAAALGAGGLVPVADGEGVLRLGGGFGIAREEAREAAVAFGGEGVNGKAPA